MDWLAWTMLATPLSVALASFRALIGTDLRSGLAELDRPTLVIHGDRDMSAPLEITGRPTAAGIPGAELRITRVPRTGFHHPRRSAEPGPDRFAEG
jgi:pimeloyl-ACP methyl ester carboxylesterase